MKHTVIFALISMPTFLFSMQKMLPIVQLATLRGSSSLAQRPQLYGVERNMFSQKCFCSTQGTKDEVRGEDQAFLDYKVASDILKRANQNRRLMKEDIDLMKKLFIVPTLGLCFTIGICPIADFYSSCNVNHIMMSYLSFAGSVGSAYKLCSFISDKRVEIYHEYPRSTIDFVEKEQKQKSDNFSLLFQKALKNDGILIDGILSDETRRSKNVPLNLTINQQDKKLKDIGQFLDFVPKNKREQVERIEDIIGKE